MSNFISLNNTYINNEKNKVSLQSEIADLERELQATELAKTIQEKKSQLVELQQQERKAEQAIIEAMEDNDMKEIKTWSWEFKLSYTPWSLQVDDESVVPADYIKEKVVKSLDRTKLKKDWVAGKIQLPWVSVDKKPKLNIKLLNE